MADKNLTRYEVKRVIPASVPVNAVFLPSGIKGERALSVPEEVLPVVAWAWTEIEWADDDGPFVAQRLVGICPFVESTFLCSIEDEVLGLEFMHYAWEGTDN